MSFLVQKGIIYSHCPKTVFFLSVSERTLLTCLGHSQLWHSRVWGNHSLCSLLPGMGT